MASISTPVCAVVRASAISVTEPAPGSIDAAAGVVTLTAEARTSAQTGVEMEAMTAAAVAALTVYDMVKGLEKGVEIAEIVLLSKTGGKSGDFRRGSARSDRGRR